MTTNLEIKSAIIVENGEAIPIATFILPGSYSLPKRKKPEKDRSDVCCFCGHISGPYCSNKECIEQYKASCKKHALPYF